MDFLQSPCAQWWDQVSRNCNVESQFSLLFSRLIRDFHDNLPKCATQDDTRFVSCLDATTFYTTDASRDSGMRARTFVLREHDLDASWILLWLSWVSEISRIVCKYNPWCYDGTLPSTLTYLHNFAHILNHHRLIDQPFWTPLSHSAVFAMPEPAGVIFLGGKALG